MSENNIVMVLTVKGTKIKVATSGDGYYTIETKDLDFLLTHNKDLEDKVAELEKKLEKENNELLAKVEGLKEQLLDRDNRMSRVCAFIWKHTKINTNDVIGTEGYPNELSLVIEKIIGDKFKELESKVAELEKTESSVRSKVSYLASGLQYNNDEGENIEFIIEKLKLIGDGG